LTAVIWLRRRPRLAGKPCPQLGPPGGIGLPPIPT